MPLNPRSLAVGSILGALVLTPGCASQRPPEPAAPPPIVLENRTINPAVLGIGEVRDGMIGATAPVEAIVQFHRPATGRDLERLSRAGVELGLHLGSQAYFAEIESGADLDELATLARWAGKVLPADKMGRELVRPRPPDVAQDPVRVLVRFEDDVRPAEALAILAGHTGLGRQMVPSRTWTIEIGRKELEDLALERRVLWIEGSALYWLPLSPLRR